MFSLDYRLSVVLKRYSYTKSVDILRRCQTGFDATMFEQVIYVIVYWTRESTPIVTTQKNNDKIPEVIYFYNNKHEGLVNVNIQAIWTGIITALSNEHNSFY